jgi:hypothetical protein
MLIWDSTESGARLGRRLAVVAMAAEVNTQPLRRLGRCFQAKDRLAIQGHKIARAMRNLRKGGQALARARVPVHFWYNT